MKKQKPVWTKASYECFKNDCICSYHCENYETCMKIANERKSRPPMLDCVETLISQGVTIPLVYSDLLFYKLGPSEINTLDLLLLQDKTFDEIVETKKISKLYLTNSLSLICKDLEFKRDNRKEGTTLQQFIKWGKETIAEDLKEYVACGVTR